MTPSRHLVLVRHAKAEPQGPEQTDHDRPLAERGVKDAGALGEWLAEQGLQPGLVLCSTAARTRETWAAAMESRPELGGVVDLLNDIYDADPSTLLQVVRDADAETEVVVLVGHSPGVPQLTAALCEGVGDLEPVKQLAEGYPTCTAAVLEVETEWADIAAGACRLTAVHTARA